MSKRQLADAAPASTGTVSFTPSIGHCVEKGDADPTVKNYSAPKKTTGCDVGTCTTYAVDMISTKILGDGDTLNKCNVVNPVYNKYPGACTYWDPSFAPADVAAAISAATFMDATGDTAAKCEAECNKTAGCTAY